MAGSRALDNGSLRGGGWLVPRFGRARIGSGRGLADVDCIRFFWNSWNGGYGNQVLTQAKGLLGPYDDGR